MCSKVPALNVLGDKIEGAVKVADEADAAEAVERDVAKRAALKAKLGK